MKALKKGNSLVTGGGRDCNLNITQGHNPGLLKKWIVAVELALNREVQGLSRTKKIKIATPHLSKSTFAMISDERKALL